MNLVGHFHFLHEGTSCQDLARISFHDVDRGDIEVGFVERRGPTWLAVVGQDDPATTWEERLDDWDKACAAVCVELTRRYDSGKPKNA